MDINSVDPNVTIRAATLFDADIVSRLSITTFRESYSDFNTQENMQLYIDGNLTPDIIEAELNDARNAFYLCQVDAVAVGFLKLRTGSEPEELKDIYCLEIERIYVLKAYQKRKIGARLMAFALDFGKEHKFELTWLGVATYNTAALYFYKQWGFEPFGQHAFVLGNDVQADILLKKMC